MTPQQTWRDGRSEHAWSLPDTIHPWVAEGQHRVRMGVGMVGPRPPWEDLLAWAEDAEGLGFDSFWAADHPTMLPDCWLCLAAVAQRTRRMRLGTLVACASYRPPVLAARLASDVDRLSGGRFVLGLGIGDVPTEFAQLGLPYLPPRERQRGLEEAIRIIYGSWYESPFSLQGEYFSAEAAAVPAPVQRPRVPLLIGGAGERVTLRQVATYADVSNFGPYDLTGGTSSAEAVRHKLAVLRAHCEVVGRPYEAILRSHFVVLLVLAESASALDAKVAAVPAGLRTAFASGVVALTVNDAIAYYHALAAAGMQYFIATMLPHDRETLELLGSRVLPALNA